MGLPMAKNVVQKCGLPVLGYDVVQQQMDAFREAGGIPVSDPAEIYKACDVILQILPTHPIIRNSVEQAIQYGKPGNVIVDLSSTAPDIILELYQQAKDAGMFQNEDRKSTRLNSSHLVISYAVFCLKKKNRVRTSSGSLFYVFFFNDTATTEIYTLSLHDALPIFMARAEPRTQTAT